MPKMQYEIHPGEAPPPPRRRPPNARMQTLIDGNIIKYPSRVAVSSLALARRGYRLKTRTAEDGWYLWAVPIGEARSVPNPKKRKRDKHKA